MSSTPPRPSEQRSLRELLRFCGLTERRGGEWVFARARSGLLESGVVATIANRYPTLDAVSAALPGDIRILARGLYALLHDVRFPLVSGDDDSVLRAPTLEAGYLGRAIAVLARCSGRDRPAWQARYLRCILAWPISSLPMDGWLPVMEGLEWAHEDPSYCGWFTRHWRVRPDLWRGGLRHLPATVLAEPLQTMFGVWRTLPVARPGLPRQYPNQTLLDHDPRVFLDATMTGLQERLARHDPETARIPVDAELLASLMESADGEQRAMVVTMLPALEPQTLVPCPPASVERDVLGRRFDVPTRPAKPVR